MADNYKRQPQKMLCQGVCLNAPVDLVPPGKYPIIENVRSLKTGTLQPRPGYAAPIGVTAMDSPVHSIIRLNNNIPGVNTWTRIVGGGTKLFAGQNPTTPSIDTGYDGNPLSMITYRPPQSPSSWAYIANANKMRKVDVAGNNFAMGIAPPVSEPTVAFAAPNIQVIDDLSAGAGWAVANFGGIATANRTDTTIAHILYDTGSTGWACINPTVMSDASHSIRPGERLIINSAETVVVHDVIQVTLSTTIAQILYDSGTSGLCSIALTASVDQLQRDTMLLLGGASEYVRVLAVVDGPLGIKSIRCVTAGTHAATDSVTAIPCFRAYTTGTRANGNTLVSTNITDTTSGTSVTATLTKQVAVDLSSINGLPSNPDDYLHISIMLDHPDYLVEAQVLVDIDSAGGAAGTVFQRNFLYHVINPATITANIISGTGYQSFISTQQKALANQQILDQINELKSTLALTQSFSLQKTILSQISALQNQLRSGGQLDYLTPGAGQWSEIKFKISDFIRVGADTSRGLQNTCAIRLQFVVTNPTAISLSSFWLGGGYGPDIAGIGAPYLYRTRARSSVTGAKSNPSPPIRSGLNAERERIIVTSALHPDAQVDTIDFFRLGGSLASSPASGQAPAWLKVGSAPNTGTPTINDDIADADLATAEELELDNFQPFPTIDIPRSGTALIAGSTIKSLTGDTFNTNWAEGSQIIIGQNVFTLDRRPMSSTLLQTYENAGGVATVAWSMPQPTLLAQPMGRMWGPLGGGYTGGRLFACGDPYQPGVLHVTKASNPDSAPETSQIEITDPSEPLINGGIYDGRPFVFSSDNLYVLFPSLAASGPEFYAQKLPGGRGLYAPWGIAVGPKIWIIDLEGILEGSLGGEFVSITDADLYPLFPHGDRPGTATNGFNPPNMTLTSDLRLAWGEGCLYFAYKDNANVRRELVYRYEDKSWWPDVHSAGAVCHYLEQGANAKLLLIGGADGKLYTVGGSSDDGATISCHILLPYFDGGDSRAEKDWGDGYIDFDGNASSINVTPQFDAGATVLGTQSFSNGSRPANPQIVDFIQGIQAARNVSLDITWSSRNTPVIYEWQASFVPKVEITQNRPTDWDNAGFPGPKFVQGCRIKADTYNAQKTVVVQYDGGTVGPTLLVKHNGESSIAYSFTTPISNAQLLRLVPNDGAPWRLLGVEWIFEPSPDYATNWITQPTTHGLTGFIYGDFDQIAHISTADLSYSLNVDGTVTNIAIPNSGGTYAKSQVRLPPLKGKSWQYAFTSAQPFQIYKNDCEARRKSWGDTGDFQTLRPFGAISAVDGARI